VESGYASVTREWKSGDRVVLHLPLTVRRVLATETDESDRGRVALERGPIVYCVESVDNDGSVSDLVLPDDAKLAAKVLGNVLGGITVLNGTGNRSVRTEEGKTKTEPAAITAIPYYAWAHRGDSSMAVWLPREPSLATPRAAATIASRSRPSASHCWHSDSITALADQIQPDSSRDMSIPRFTWWNHRGGTEWVQYDFSKPAQISSVSVYWFDDEPAGGQCRVPGSWQLLYRDGDQWKPVTARSAFGVEQNRFNVVEFEPVTTDAVRISAELKPDMSGGILEWSVR
jgi:hypothetical protein